MHLGLWDTQQQQRLLPPSVEPIADVLPRVAEDPFSVYPRIEAALSTETSAPFAADRRGMATEPWVSLLPRLTMDRDGLCRES
jgi:hypothetical protein